MEVKLFVCALTLAAFMVSGSNAQPDVCGIAQRNTKIVGGQEAVQWSWPWMASIKLVDTHRCAGTLINNQWVLTAAQCVFGQAASNFTIYFGVDTLYISTPFESYRKVSRIVMHPNFNPATFDNDVALLQLSSPIAFSSYVTPVCLAAPLSTWNAGTSCWVTGWGRIQTNTPIPYPGKLREVSIPVVSNGDCNNVYGIITDNHMCAGPAEGGKGTCAGDAGGPLIKKIGSKWVQAGVASFVSAAGCAVRNLPGGYARVSRYQLWINMYMDGNEPGYVLSGTPALVSLSSPLLMSILLVLFSAL